MKKRRTLIISLLLIAALALGIGYAALTDDLFIDATANFDPKVAEDELDVDVKFIDPTTSNDYCNAGVSGNDASGDTAYLHIGGEDVPFELTTPGQSAEAVYTVENNYEAAVNVSIVTDLTTLSAKYDIVINVDDAQNIPSGGTGTITVTITPKEVLTESFSNVQFRMELLATVVE